MMQISFAVFWWFAYWNSPTKLPRSAENGELRCCPVTNPQLVTLPSLIPDDRGSQATFNQFVSLVVRRSRRPIRCCVYKHRVDRRPLLAGHASLSPGRLRRTCHLRPLSTTTRRQAIWCDTINKVETGFHSTYTNFNKRKLMFQTFKLYVLTWCVVPLNFLSRLNLRLKNLC